MGEIYDEVRVGDKSYQFPKGKENFTQKMFEYFPDHKEEIKAYLKLIAKANRKAQMFFFEKTFKPILAKTIGPLFKKGFQRFAQKSTLDTLKEITDNDELIAVLCAQCGNYGLSPKYSSFSAHALIVGHFMEGGYYPNGGSETLAEAAIQKLNSNQGKVYINSQVEAINVENKRVTGVTVNGKFIACKSVISNVGVLNTNNHLLKANATIIDKQKFGNIKRSTGHICLYVGVKGNSHDLGLPKNNIWSFSSNQYDKIFDAANLKDAGKDFTYISFPSSKDALAQNDISTIQIVTIGRHEWLEKYENEPWRKRSPEYQKIKDQVSQNLIQALLKIYPHLEDKIEFHELSTPLSTQHFTQYDKGEIYGLEHSSQRFLLPFLRPETKIKGLRLAGQDITVVGVAGAMLSGMLCAITILKFKVWRVFYKMTKIEIPKNPGDDI